MTAVPEGYRIRVNKSPTLWNREAAMGCVIGSFIPIPFAPLIGAAIGAFIGKKRMQNESAEGREVKSPTVFNKKFFTGAMWGSVASFGIAVATVGVGVITAIASGGTAIPAIMAISGVGSLLAWAAPLVGGIMGAVSGKKQMAEEYTQAESEIAAQQHSMQPTTQRIKEQQVDYGPSHPAHGKSASHFRDQYQQRAPQPGSPALNARG